MALSHSEKTCINSLVADNGRDLDSFEELGIELQLAHSVMVSRNLYKGVVERFACALDWDSGIEPSNKEPGQFGGESNDVR